MNSIFPDLSAVVALPRRCRRATAGPTNRPAGCDYSVSISFAKPGAEKKVNFG